MTRRIPRAGLILLGALAALFVVIAVLLLWTTFMVYDDEGYVLYSLRTFSSHGHLYDRVYSQYGPFLYVLYAGLHALGLEFTNNAGRAMALVCWMGSVGLCGAVVWRETRGSLLATAATMTGVFVHLWSMVAEPSHPGGLIALATAVAAWVGTHRGIGRIARWAAIGALGAMVTLMKVNTGVFLFASAGTWWVLHWPPARHSRWVRPVLSVLLASMPPLLMAGLLEETWVRMFAWTIAAAVVGLLMVFPSDPSETTTKRQFAAASLAAIAVTIVTTALVLGTGTTFRELLDGVILGPLRHPLVYAGPFTWRAGALLFAIGALPACMLLTRLPLESRAGFVFVGRFALLAGYAACATSAFDIDLQPYVLSYGTITAWVLVLSWHPGDRTQPTRGWLALLLVLQTMHAYPVAGSQLSWGTFLWVPLAVLAMHDAAGYMRSPGARRIAAFAAAATVILVGGEYSRIACQRIRHGDDLHTRGAEHLRLPTSFSTAIRLLVQNAKAHGDMLFTLPGMMSFNVWTGLKPPTDANTTHWFNLLSAEQQEAIRQRLAGDPRSVLIVQRSLCDFLERRHIIPRSPMLQWLQSHYERAFRVETYEFWVRKGRRIAAVDSAQLLVGVPGAPFKYKVVIVVNTPRPVEVATLQLRKFVVDDSVRAAAWTLGNARCMATPVTLDGVPLAPAAELKLPGTLSGTQKLEVFTDDVPAGFKDGTVWLLDRQGRKIGEARVIE